MKTQKTIDKAYRTGRDPLGEKQIPAEALYGVQTFRALENFQISKLRIRTFDENCVKEIKAHRDICQNFAERTVGQAARLNEERGFFGAAEIAMRAIDENKSVQEILGEEKLK